MSEMIERVADAIEAAQVGFCMTLVRLVEGVSTYSLKYDDGEVIEFGDTDECYEHINAKKRSAQARAAIEAMREPTVEMVIAAAGDIARQDIVLDEDYSGPLSPVAIYHAMIDAALSKARASS